MYLRSWQSIPRSFTKQLDNLQKFVGCVFLPCRSLIPVQAGQ